MKRTALATMTALILGTAAFAGPPLICHPYTTGKGASLPWASGTSWNTPDPRYDTANLTKDTLGLLESGMPLLNRMETLRRAAIYSSKDRQAALDLANRLTARALQAELTGQNDSLALFDAGYFIESMKQMAHVMKSETIAAIDGYEWARRSLPGLQDKPTAEYALGLMQAATSWPNAHLLRAAMGAQEGSLLAKNLARHYPDQTLAEIRRTLATEAASR